MLQNSKKWLIMIGVILIIIIAIIVGIIVFRKTNIFQKETIKTQEKPITIGQINEIDIVYYCAQNIKQSKESIHVSLSQEEQNIVEQKLKNWQFEKYSNSTNLNMIEQYEVTLNENNKFTFDNDKTNNQENIKYVKWYHEEKSTITAIPKEVLEVIINRVNIPLELRNKKFETEKITITNGEKTVQIQDKQVLNQTVSNCKYVAEINSKPEGSIKYQLDFNNGIQISIYNQNGTLENTSVGSVPKNVEIPNIFIQIAEQVLANN